MSGTLAIVGAGAKAVAVAAKAAALRQMGVETVDVVAIERSSVAANWRAGGGWTDGLQRLGTSPEKTSASRTARRWSPAATPSSTSG